MVGRRQDGVFGVQQLYDVGFSETQLRRCVRQGRLIRRHRGVYLDALVKPTQRGRLLAAQLALGDTAFLSRRTGLGLYGARAVNLYEIEVTVVADHTPSHQGLRVHRTTIAPSEHELRMLNGLRVASPSLALVETAGRETDQELDRLLAELARRQLLDLEQIDAAIDRRRRLRGVRRLRAALARYRPATAADISSFERDFANWLAQHPEIPPPTRNARLGPWELDFYWPAQRVVLETDGAPYHRTPDELERDRRKDVWLQRHDHRVIRVTGFRFAHDRTGILADLAAMVKAA